jgi:hypothetical protein
MEPEASNTIIASSVQGFGGESSAIAPLATRIANSPA